MTNSMTSPDVLSNAIEGGPVFDRMLVYSEDDWAHMRVAAGLFRAIQWPITRALERPNFMIVGMN